MDNKVIDSFEGKYFFLSNFYEYPITIADVTYPTNEHYFQAMKAIDPAERSMIIAAPTPGKAKQLGRHTKLRSDWEEVKYNVMYEAVYHKFCNPEMGKKLLLTGTAELIEGNFWHDTYWGMCDGKGQNNLGKILMDVRAYLVETALIEKWFSAEEMRDIYALFYPGKEMPNWY